MFRSMDRCVVPPVQQTGNDTLNAMTGGRLYPQAEMFSAHPRIALTNAVNVLCCRYYEYCCTQQPKKECHHGQRIPRPFFAWGA